MGRQWPSSAARALAHTNGLVQALAVNALNALVGSVDAPGGVSFMPQGSAPAAPARTFRDALGSAAPQVLLLDEANLLFASPSAWKVADWLRQVPFVASFGSFIDDTSAHADLILPDHSFLESWVDSVPESGAGAAVATVAGPVMKPLYDTRSTPDVLLDVGRALKQPPNPPLPWKTFEEMAQAAADAAPATAASRPAAQAQSPSAAARPTAWRAAEFDGDAQAYPFHFAPYASQALFDGSLAHLPWLQELPDPLTTAMWCSWVEINPQAAGEARRSPMATSSRSRPRTGRCARRSCCRRASARTPWRCRWGRGTNGSRGTRAGAARIR